MISFRNSGLWEIDREIYSDRVMHHEDTVYVRRNQEASCQSMPMMNSLTGSNFLFEPSSPARLEAYQEIYFGGFGPIGGFGAKLYRQTAFSTRSSEADCIISSAFLCRRLCMTLQNWMPNISDHYLLNCLEPNWCQSGLLKSKDTSLKLQTPELALPPFQV